MCLLLFLLFLQEAPQGLAALFQEYTTQGTLATCSSFYTRLSISVLIRFLPNPFSIIKRPDSGSQKNLPPWFSLPALVGRRKLGYLARRREEVAVVCGVGECTLLGNCCLFSAAALLASLCFCSAQLRVGQSPGLLSLQTSWPLRGQPRRSPQPPSGLIVCGNNSELGNFPLSCSVDHCN